VPVAPPTILQARESHTADCFANPPYDQSVLRLIAVHSGRPKQIRSWPRTIHPYSLEATAKTATMLFLMRVEGQTAEELLAEDEDSDVAN